MPSEGRAAWNKEYYAKNADDILYRAKQSRKVAKTISCPCADYARYKDIPDNKRKHFASKIHQSYKQKMLCVKILTDDFNHTREDALMNVESRAKKKCGAEYTGKAGLNCFIDYEFVLRKQFINHKKNTEAPVTKNIVIEKKELEQQPLQPPIANPLILLPVTQKNAIIPAHDGQGFDPMGLIRPLGWENDVPEPDAPIKLWYHPEPDSDEETEFNLKEGKEDEKEVESI